MTDALCSPRGDTCSHGRGAIACRASAARRGRYAAPCCAASRHCRSRIAEEREVANRRDPPGAHSAGGRDDHCSHHFYTRPRTAIAPGARLGNKRRTTPTAESSTPIQRPSSRCARDRRETGSRAGRDRALRGRACGENPSLLHRRGRALTSVCGAIPGFARARRADSARSRVVPRRVRRRAPVSRARRRPSARPIPRCCRA